MKRVKSLGRVTKAPKVVEFRFFWTCYFDHSDAFEHGMRVNYDTTTPEYAKAVAEHNMASWLASGDEFALSWIPEVCAVLGLDVPSAVTP